MGHIICPKPLSWQETYERLVDVVRQGGCSPPPLPLILAGWAYTNDREKQLRWLETIAWAENHGCAELVRDLPAGSMYVVEDIFDYEIGPGGGPMYLPWNFDPKGKVNDRDKQVAIDKLRANWPETAGSIGALTEPLRFTGAKSRRLLVGVNSDVPPPWGSWTKLEASVQRRHFTRFRASVNATIAPLAVDHVEFVQLDTIRLSANSC